MNTRGVALIIVLWVIMVLSLLISGFAFRMHVETQVASFSRKELKAEMLARSGVEIARMQLILDQRSPTDAAFDALNQAWATNADEVADLYVDRPLGEGRYNVKVTDEESKLPINSLSEAQMRQLMDVLGIDPADGDVIVDSILDWIDGDDLHKLNGAETDYYQSLSPAYTSKNGPLDRIEELLLIRGVTKEIFYGQPETADEPALPALADMVTTLTSGQVNVNTASAPVLRALLGLDESQVEAMITRRDGADGVPGTEDDQPFRSVADFISQLGSLPAAAQERLNQLLTVNSTFFTVKSTGEVGGVKRTIEAVLLRQGDNVQVVTWKEVRGGPFMISLLKPRKIASLGAHRTWAAVFFGESSLDYATAKTAGGRIDDQTSSVPVPTSEGADLKTALDAAVQSLRQKLDPREHRIVTAVGCDDVLCQSLRLPTTQDTELKQMLELQIDNLTPLPLEDVVYSFEAIEKTETETKVLVAVARKTAVNKHVAALEAAGLEAEVVGVDALAVFRTLVRRGVLPRDEKLNALVLFSTTAANVIIYCGGNPVAIRSIVLGEGALTSAENQTALHEELARTLVAAEAEMSGGETGRVTFATWSDRLRGEVEELARSWGEHAEFLGNGSAPSPAMSLCVETAAEVGARLNLLPEEWRRRRKTRRVRQMLIRGVIAAGAVYLLALVVFLTMVGIRQAQTNKVDSQIKALRPKFGEARQLHKLLIEMQKQIDPKSSAIEVLREVSTLMPENLKLNSFDFKKDATLKLRGQTPSAAMATEFISRLEKCDLFAKVQTVGMRADPGGGGLTKFDVVCSLKSGASAPPAGPSWR